MELNKVFAFLRTMFRASAAVTGQQGMQRKRRPAPICLWRVAPVLDADGRETGAVDVEHVGRTNSDPGSASKAGTPDR